MHFITWLCALLSMGTHLAPDHSLPLNELPFLRASASFWAAARPEKRGGGGGGGGGGGIHVQERAILFRTAVSSRAHLLIIICRHKAHATSLLSVNWHIQKEEKFECSSCCRATEFHGV